MDRNLVRNQDGLYMYMYVLNDLELCTGDGCKNRPKRVGSVQQNLSLRFFFVICEADLSCIQTLK